MRFYIYLSEFIRQNWKIYMSKTFLFRNGLVTWQGIFRVLANPKTIYDIPCVQTFENVNGKMTGTKHLKKPPQDFQAFLTGLAVHLVDDELKRKITTSVNTLSLLISFTNLQKLQYKCRYATLFACIRLSAAGTSIHWTLLPVYLWFFS